MQNTLRRGFGNTVSILTSDVVNRITYFILYAMVARYLGVFEFGQMTIALTVFYTFQVLAVAGLKTFITREVARDKTKTDKYIVNGSAVVACCSLLALVVLMLFVWLMNYSDDTASIILLLSLALLPYALSAVSESIFQAWEKMHYIAWANVPANIIQVSLAFLLLSLGYSLGYLMILLSASYVVKLGVEWWFLHSYITKPKLRIDLGFCLTMIRSTITFLGLDVVIAISASLSIILLSKLASETEVGLYNAASQLLMPLMIICLSIKTSTFPVICMKFDRVHQSVKQMFEHLIELVVVITFPFVVGLFFLADSALLLLYGDNKFLLASDVLRIRVWGLLLIAINYILGMTLLATMREKINLRISTINMLVNLVFGLILISQFGLIGAAITALLTIIVSFSQVYVYVVKILPNLALGRLVWKPIVASACMAFYLIMMRGQGIILVVLSAGLLYVGILLVLAIWSVGGTHQLKVKYLYPWSE